MKSENAQQEIYIVIHTLSIALLSASYNLRGKSDQQRKNIFTNCSCKLLL